MILRGKTSSGYNENHRSFFLRRSARQQILTIEVLILNGSKRNNRETTQVIDGENSLCAVF